MHVQLEQIKRAKTEDVVPIVSSHVKRCETFICVYIGYWNASEAPRRTINIYMYDGLFWQKHPRSNLRPRMGNSRDAFHSIQRCDAYTSWSVHILKRTHFKKTTLWPMRNKWASNYCVYLAPWEKTGGKTEQDLMGAKLGVYCICVRSINKHGNDCWPNGETNK